MTKSMLFRPGVFAKAPPTIINNPSPVKSNQIRGIDKQQGLARASRWQNSVHTGDSILLENGAYLLQEDNASSFLRESRDIFLENGSLLLQENGANLFLVEYPYPP